MKLEVTARVAEVGPTLTRAERRVAEVVLDRPQLVGFGTVAELAEAAGAGAATVVRLAAKLGYDGFTALQASVQRDLARQLRPAAERIREPPAGGAALGQHLALELDNVQTTLQGLAADALPDAVDHLADLEHEVLFISGDASMGVAQQIVGDLAALRPGVDLLTGTEISTQRRIALLSAGDTVVGLDLKRYDRWVIDALERARARDVWMLALTDSLLSPLAQLAQRTMVLTAAALGPFDSHVGTLALGNVLVAGVADRLRESAAVRLERAEHAWRSAGSLVEP